MQAYLDDSDSEAHRFGPASSSPTSTNNMSSSSSSSSGSSSSSSSFSSSYSRSKTSTGGSSPYGSSDSSSDDDSSLNESSILSSTLKSSASTSLLNSSAMKASNTSLVPTRKKDGKSRSENGIYADDDSVVSSHDSVEDGLPIAGRAVKQESSLPPQAIEQRQLMTNAPPTQSGILPRNKRECFFVLFAVVVIIAVAVGVGLGIGFYVSTWDNSSIDNSKEIVSDPAADYTPEGESGIDESTPSSFPTFINGSSPSEPYGVAIETVTVDQGISSIESFSSENATTAQQQAFEFLVKYDRIPVGLADEENETVSTPNVRKKTEIKTEPYLSTSSPLFRVVQRYAISTFYYATQGDEWQVNDLWVNAGVHECEWIGVICEERNIPAISLGQVVNNPDVIPTYDDSSVNTVNEMMIIEINLPENGLKGYLPKEIAGIPFLQTLGLWSNQIGDTLPEQIGNFTNLIGLHLDDNQFEGSIPTQIGLLSKMKDLSLPNNKFVGVLPSEILNLEKLERLWIYNTEINGELPDMSYKTLQNLQDLNMKNNKFGGKLPNGIKDLTSLQSLDLSSNQLSSSIPSSWSSLVNLQKFALNNNRLRGQVPDIFDSFSKLESIALDINAFSGNIPSTIGSAGATLKKLTLGDNKFEGDIPDTIRDCVRLRQLEMNSNQLRGSIATWFGELVRLEYLDLSDNMLSGNIPSELSELVMLKELRIDGNLLEGTVPCPFATASVISSDCSPRGGGVTCSCCTRCS